MGRFEQISAKVSALPIERQDMVADLIEQAFDLDWQPKSLLTPSQIEELRLILAQPQEAASQEDLEAAFGGWDK